MDALTILEYFRTAPVAEARRTLDLANAILNPRGGKGRRIRAAPPEEAERPKATKESRQRKPGRQRQPDSIRAWSELLMKEAGALHVNTLTKAIQERFHRNVTSATVAGGLARLAKQRDTFVRTAPNTYGLIEVERKRN